MHRCFRLAAALALLVCGAPVASADVKLPALFSDNMVLQRGLACPVWGSAEPGEQVTVSIGGQKKTAEADKEGKWTLKLEPLPAGGPLELTVAGKNTIVVKNVLVGEVWLCSGQSNMEMQVRGALNPKEEMEAANQPKIRYFHVPAGGAAKPATDVKASWKVCDPETVGGFSAVAYFFGRDLQKTLDVPVGLIHASVSGKAAECFTSLKVLEGLDGYRKQPDYYKEVMAEHRDLIEKHKERAGKAKAEGKPVPQAPEEPKSPPGDPASHYHAMIRPLVPYGIRGAIWYQGEANRGLPRFYRQLFPALIQNWRDDWGQGDFPFLYVQLANFRGRDPYPSEKAIWAELREVQLQSLAVPKTGMAVTIDIGEGGNIHPRNKQDVGKRLALAAGAVAYGNDLVYSGPLYDALKVEGDKARVRFKHTGGGLLAKGDKLKGFVIAADDKKFVWAEAKIDGASVLVWSDQVVKPAHVRYAWADNPDCNLYNKEGLPATPFRTDR